MAQQYVDAYRRYCWSVGDISDLKLAPFHILATEGSVHTDKDHRWHMEQVAKFAQCDPELLLATTYKVIDLTDLAVKQKEFIGGKNSQIWVVKV